MGLSMGGMIGMTHALKYPGRFDRMILCNTTSRVPPEAGPTWQGRIETVTASGMEPVVAPTLERWFTAPFREHRPEVMASVGALIRATPPAGFIGCCHAIPKINLTDRLGAVQCPTLVIGGDHDVGTPVEMARAIQLAIPGAQLAVIPFRIASVESGAARDLQSPRRQFPALLGGRGTCAFDSETVRERGQILTISTHLSGLCTEQAARHGPLSRRCSRIILSPPGP